MDIKSPLLIQKQASIIFRGLYQTIYVVIFSIILSFLSVMFNLSHAQDNSPVTQLPILTDRVVDNAHLLDAPTEAALVQKLAAFQQQSSDQVVVVTVPSLSGEDIESYSNRLFRAWALGQKQEDNGILLVVAPNERRVRIEVGYGLEAIMTDAMSSIIIQSIILPAFRDGNYSGGITDGVDGILSVLSGDTEALKDRAKRSADTSLNDDTDWLEVTFIVFWMIIFFGGFGLAVMAPIFGRKIAPGRYEWLGFVFDTRGGGGGSSGRGGGWSSGGGGFSSGGGFSGGGGSSGGGGASGSW